MVSPVRPFLSTVQNNRDHRKICVIDGKVAFTGGVISGMNILIVRRDLDTGKTRQLC